ncbi:MAG: DUF5654 family protein [Candidatus Aenigmarchaeota archaeon]|nr:DUF5654 family protein [Candidatus Aenigmarchaeota archaeon]
MKEVVEEIKKQTLTLMSAALGFVAALIWKDAISAWLAPLYKDASGAMNLTIAAFVITIVVFSFINISIINYKQIRKNEISA